MPKRSHNPLNKGLTYEDLLNADGQLEDFNPMEEFMPDEGDGGDNCFAVACAIQNHYNPKPNVDFREDPEEEREEKSNG